MTGTKKVQISGKKGIVPPLEHGLKRLQNTHFFSVVADECTIIMTVEELSVFCHWKENSTHVECFLEIVFLKKANAERIYISLVMGPEDKKHQFGNIVGMGFDGNATIKKIGVKLSKTEETCYICSICPLSLSQAAVSLCASYQ